MPETKPRLIVLIVICVVGIAALIPILTNAQSGTPSPQAVDGDRALIAEGQELFESICIACHQADGAGIEGIYPALAGNSDVTLADPEYVTLTVLYGRGGMPRFNDLFTDAQIAAVISYVRSGLEGNHAAPITPDYVQQVRTETETVLAASPATAASGTLAPSPSPVP